MSDDRTCLDCGQDRYRSKNKGGRGLCQNCYYSRRRRGLLGELPKRNYSFEEHLAAIVPDANGCWPWPGPIHKTGYGYTERHARAHVKSYEYHIGPVPEKHDVGHQCHDQDESCQDWRKCAHRRCINPDHLKAMTRSDNLKARPWRKKVCLRGHDMTNPDNFYITSAGSRQCIPCVRFVTKRGPLRKRRKKTD